MRPRPEKHVRELKEKQKCEIVGHDMMLGVSGRLLQGSQV